MATDSKIRLLIVDDHPVVVDGLCAILSRQRDMSVVGSAGDCQSALRLFRECNPDVTLMDLRLPDQTGVEAIREMRKLDPKARILVLTTYSDEEDVLQAVRAGASGYLLKDAPREELVENVRAVFDNRSVFPPQIAARLAAHLSRPSLTDREIEVLKLVAAGKANKEIATLLNISQGTVKAHVKNLMEKLSATSRTEAAHVALQAGIIRMD